MKELMIEWAENHTFEHDDGTWSRADDSGESVGPRYATREELEKALWDHMDATACYLPQAR